MMTVTGTTSGLHPTRWPWLALLVPLLAACSAAAPSEDVGEAAFAASEPELVAGKAVRVWTNLNGACEPDPGGVNVCVGLACTEQPFTFTFTFRNRGSAVWRDVTGRGTDVGSDVFLETANGKQDPLTGSVRFSVKRHTNNFVRWDRNASECVTKRGCRRTRSVKGGMISKAPSTPGVTISRWRLRDYSKAWSKAQGFGPKVAFQLKTVDCGDEWCGCRVNCNSGESHRVWWKVNSDAECAAVGEEFCGVGKVTSHEFHSCEDTTGPGGYSSPPGETPPDEPEDDDDGWWYAPSDPEENEQWHSTTGDSIGTELPDDPDYTPSGFDGVDPEESKPWNAPKLGRDGGCRAAPGRGESGGLVALLGALGLLVRRRRRDLGA